MIKENDIAYCVRKSVESYLKDLDGERPHPLHDMVISSVEKPLIEMVLKYAGVIRPVPLNCLVLIVILFAVR